jgi:hypothetical protein
LCIVLANANRDSWHVSAYQGMFKQEIGCEIQDLRICRSLLLRRYGCGSLVNLLNRMQARVSTTGKLRFSSVIFDKSHLNLIRSFVCSNDARLEQSLDG